MSFVIYKITQPKNNKSYIGYSGNFKRRWKEHKKAATRGVDLSFSRALRKYGPETFEISFLEENIMTEEMAGLAEIKWIAKFKSNDNKYGYNLTTGGARPPSTPESIEKMKRSLAITQNTAEYKNNQSEKMTAYLDNNPEARDRLVQIHKEYYKDPANRKKFGDKKREYFNIPGNREKHSKRMKEAAKDRPHKERFSEEERKEMIRLHSENVSLRKIAKLFNTSSNTLRKYKIKKDQ